MARPDIVSYELNTYKHNQPKIGTRVRDFQGNVIGKVAALKNPGSCQKFYIKPNDQAKAKLEALYGKSDKEQDKRIDDLTKK